MTLTNDGYTFELADGITREHVAYRNLHGIQLAADLYRPADLDTSVQHPAIVIGPPHGGVKEQGPGVYANQLAQNGFVVLAHDPSFYGESGGNPRHFTSPEILTEDFSAGVDFLGSLPYVDRDRIGLIGICASGGFALNAASIDPRVRAVAAMTMYDIPGLAHDGWNFEGTAQDRRDQLSQLAQARWADVDGHGRGWQPGFPLGDYDASRLEPITAEFFEYYARVNDRGWHPRSIGAHTVTSSILHVAYGRLSNLEDLAGRPVLIAVGENAHSRWFSEKTFQALPEGDKQLVIVPGARHIDLYDDVTKIPFEQLTSFFAKNL